MSGAIDLGAYLARLGLEGRPTLAQLHRAHVVAIPFENLDPHRGIPVSVELRDIERKLVDARRGGYCFEHNLLFAAALRGLGYVVEPMLARVGARDDASRSLTHLLLRVVAEGMLWHADVGFGAGTLLEPIPFGPGSAVVQSGWRRRIVRHGPQLVLQGAGDDCAWSDIYRFLPMPVAPIDIEMSNWFTATHPESGFVRSLVAAVHAADGTRTVLTHRAGPPRLAVQTPAGETVVDVEPAALPQLLAERFGLPGWTLDERERPVPSAGASATGPLRRRDR